MTTMNDLSNKLDDLETSLGARLDTMTSEIETLVRANSLISDNQETQNEMLGSIMEACAADAGPSHELHTALEKIAAAIEHQNDVLERINARLAGIGQTVEISVKRGVALATRRDIDEDGVIIDPAAPADDYGF